jgi:hypothetical protein
MKSNKNYFIDDCTRHSSSRTAAVRAGGIVLLMTIVVLVVLASVGYMLAYRVAAQRHRDNYLIDYTNACYARDSVLKYAIAALQDLNDIKYAERPNEPDFSDVFSMNAQKYREMIDKWAKEHPEELAKLLGASDTQSQSLIPQDDNSQDDNSFGIPLATEGNDSNSGLASDSNKNTDIADKLKIRGPYGPEWPLVTEATQFEIGSTIVKIQIEDEDAKYPVGWAIMNDEKTQREVQASFQTFFEWMGYSSDRIESVSSQIQQIGAIKPFKVEFQPVVQRAAVPQAAAPNTAKRGTRPARTAYKTTSVQPIDLISKQTREFSILFHSSMLDTQILASPTVNTETRKESAMKYMGLWGSTQVNINSAPRHVLEAAFTFGGDGTQIAEEIIKRRQIKPFKDIDELKKELFRFSDSIDKCKAYINTNSKVFTIHITAVNGAAKASVVVVVLRDGGKIERVAVVCG